MVLQLNKRKTRLFSVAGTHGIAVFDVDMHDQGKVVEGAAPVCSPTTEESMATPLGVFPTWLTVDAAEETVYSCNFFSQNVTALPFDQVSRKCGAPIGVCAPAYPGTPDKVAANVDQVSLTQLGLRPGPIGLIGPVHPVIHHPLHTAAASTIKQHIPTL